MAKRIAAIKVIRNNGRPSHLYGSKES